MVANAQGISLRLPTVPFLLSPFQVLREETVTWSEADLGFTPGKRSRLLVSSARPGTAIPSGQFQLSLDEIDAGLRSAAERLDRGQARIEEAQVFSGTSPAVLLVAGIACVGLFGTGMVSLMEATGLASLLAFGVIFGLALIAMGASPRKRLVLDPRGLFVERGEHLDFIPREILDGARTEYSGSRFGAFESAHVEAKIGRSKLRIGFNRIFGLGFPVHEIMEALNRG